MSTKRISVWILGDQLLANHPGLDAASARVGKENVSVIMVESRHITSRLPYNRKKLVLIFSAMRHYANRLRSQGYAVDYRQSDTMSAALSEHVKAYSPDLLMVMAASDYGGRHYQRRLSGELNIQVKILANTMFLTSQFNPYPDPNPDKRYTMEYFYRSMRSHFQILMDGDSPEGGNWNYDKDNRKPLPKDIQPPDLPQFKIDDITNDVMREVENYEHGVGRGDGFNYAVTHEQAYAALGTFIQARLAEFGPYEDAMTSHHGTLFHSVLSPYVNIGLLEPMQMIRAVERAYYDGNVPINSAEGFIRQVLGWREFMYWQYWRMMPDLATSNTWQADRPVPDFFWTGETNMNCMKHLVTNAIETAYSHHIERLMLASNFALLAGVKPQAMLNWFRSMYIDAYDWVMQPNVIGMGLNADGGQIATKPYIASANYINKMSDYCKSCTFHHKQRSGENACPFNLLYWNFLLEHEAELRSNPRSGRNVLGLRHLSEDEKQRIQQEAGRFLDELFDESNE